MRGELQAGRREAAGDCGARSMHRGERVRLQIGGQGVRRCTWNISRIVVTRDVSKFSGWLNANARCGAKRRRFYDAAHGAGRAGGGGCSRMWHKR